MTVYSKFIDTSRRWSARPDMSDELMESFVRSAEAYVDREIRVKEAVTILEDSFDVDGKFTMPDDYNELMYIRPIDGEPLHYQTYDVYFTGADRVGKYTTVGNAIICSADLYASKEFEVGYYKKVPHFGVSNADTPTWLFTYYYDIYLQSVNVALLFYAQEWERSTALQELVMSWIAKANGNSKTAQMSGSPLIRRTPRRIG